MGRTNRGRSATTLQRTVKVVLPSQDILETWRSDAKASSMSLSKYLWTMAERGREGGIDLDSREILAERIQTLTQSLTEAEHRIDTLDRLTQRQEEELQGYRTRDFTEPFEEGTRVFDTRLVLLLRDQGFIHTNHLYELLGIDPRTEPKRIEAVQAQLDILGSYGLVEFSTRGWWWRG